tara:strand:+ start:91 stop:681 length:591 start_codon:yes stop_codon:yes gene_type:complete
MKYNLNEIREKFFEALAPSNKYTIEDFNNEYQNVNHTLTTSSDYKLQIKFLNKSSNIDPEYHSDGAAGFDFRADIETPIEIPGKNSDNNIVMVPTGLYFELPKNMELQVRPRSGLAAKHGITVLNSPGTVDCDYRGEVKIILINHSSNSFTINPGDRIAQGVINSVMTRELIDLEKVNELNKTQRENGGFGSTGIK